MGRFLIGLVVGLLVGAGLIYWFLIGPPRSDVRPGEVVRQPDPSGVPAGTAQIVLRQDMLNEALGAIFNELKPPEFPLGSERSTTDPSGQTCTNAITIIPQGSGVQTSVQFADARLTAPLAFSGNWNSPVGCIPFSGWAQSNLELRFDRNTQNVYGVLNVETVNLDGVNPIWNGLITPIVQSTINTRVNPIKIVDGKQLSVDLPIKASGGDLRAAVTDVRSEVNDNALNLFVIYDFGGMPAAPAAQQ